jgi:hypothetical protein
MIGFIYINILKTVFHSLKKHKKIISFSCYLIIADDYQMALQIIK